MEIKIDPKAYMSESKRRKKKGGNKRSKMLRMVMPHLSRKTGDALADAIDNKKVSDFKRVWDKVKQEIANKLASESSSEDVQDVAEAADNLDSVYDSLIEHIVKDLNPYK